MIILAVFILLIFLYSLISARLKQTIITAPILFTIGGMMLGVADLQPDQVSGHGFLLMAEIGLVMLLFTDATHIHLKNQPNREHLTLRLLTIGMLLTILLGAVCAKLIYPSLTLWEAGILAAILAPTDAGLGQVIVQSPRVPSRIRQSLDMEAGLNDGLSVPFLMFFIAVSQLGTESSGQVLFRYLYEQLGMGALVGLCVGMTGGILLGLAHRHGWMEGSFQQLGVVALPVVSILACEPLGGSMFIAAYIAGLAVQFGFGEAGRHSMEFTEGWGQLFAYFVFFLFGLLAARAFGQFTLIHLGYAILSLTLIRMLPVAIALLGTRMSTATVLFMGWFGPRGLASIVLGLVFLEHEAILPGEGTIKLAVIMTVMLSIFAHGISALPGIERYSRKMAGLDDNSPEKRQ